MSPRGLSRILAVVSTVMMAPSPAEANIGMQLSRWAFLLSLAFPRWL